ncbi:MAG: hypothetical protein ACYTG3_02825 [Planctomycetota bacterium]|jgi:hypothetical protein
MSSLADYKRAIKHLLGCYSVFKRFAPVSLQGEVNWQGFVAIFDLAGHPCAERCYAWPDMPSGSSSWRFATVLHGEDASSPAEAVLWATRQARAEYGRLEQETGLALQAAGAPARVR